MYSTCRRDVQGYLFILITYLYYFIIFNNHLTAPHPANLAVEAAERSTEIGSPSYLAKGKLHLDTD